MSNLEPDIWNPMKGKCRWCDEPIHATPMISLDSEAVTGAARIVDIWTHVNSGHERCTGRDTLAEPGGRPIL